MLTGRQLRAARTLLGLQRSKLAERVGLSTFTIKLAESSEGECPITVARAQQIQCYLERQGIELLPEGNPDAARFIDRRGPRDPKDARTAPA